VAVDSAMGHDAVLFCVVWLGSCLLDEGRGFELDYSTVPVVICCHHGYAHLFERIVGLLEWVLMMELVSQLSCLLISK